MQRLIGISQDSAIANIPLPLENLVDAFAKDIMQKGPTLQPMRFALDHTYSHPWNHKLADIFVNHFLQELDHNATEEDVSLIHEICRQRFDTLQGIWRRHQAAEGEDSVDVRKRLQERREHTGSRSRKNTRRQTVSNWYFEKNLNSPCCSSITIGLKLRLSTARKDQISSGLSLLI